MLKKLSKNKPVLFTTPGHSQGRSVERMFKNIAGSKLFNIDFSEIEGLDNIQHPRGIIQKSLKRASDIYNSKASFYLINGSTSGIIALMLATLKENDKVLLARNSHRSVINALILTGARPIWINTCWSNEWNIPGTIDIEDLENKLAENLDVKSVFLTSPTYEGIISDVGKVSQLCNKHNVSLIVDEAHGALWNFSEKLPSPAILLGSDATVQSLHKTASCLNQGAILHISEKSKIDPQKVQQCLNIINTTSPSYILLASIESSIEYLNSQKGKAKLDALLNNIDDFKRKLKKDCDINFLEKYNGFDTDKTKLCFSLNNLSGVEVAEFIESEFNIEVELCNNKSLMALTGIGTNKKKLDLLAKSIILAEKNLTKNKYKSIINPLLLPETVLTPKQAFCSRKDSVRTEHSVGKISGETVVSYPPGIPVLIEGEVIKQEHLNFISKNEVLAINSI